MKKKGLIVATIVMVLVLAVSLTTATYAWFSETSTVQVDTIDFSVTSGGDVMIGVHKDNKFTDGDKSAANYRSGTTTYAVGGTFAAAGTWDGTQGLGYNIDLTGPNGALSFATMSKAVGTGSYNSTNNALSTADATIFDINKYANGLIRAEGNSEGASATTIEQAWKQQHYLDIVIGVQVTRSDLTDISCYVTINPTDTLGTNMVGMNAAIHCVWAVDGGTLQDKDIYDGINYTVLNNEVTNEVTGIDNLNDIGGGNVQLNPGAMTFKIQLATASGSPTLTTGEIHEVHLIIFVAGYDDDCIDPAKGVGATINITFGGTRQNG